jgi:putative transposase
MRIKRHSAKEITTKLQQAGVWAAQGKSQSEIAKALGVSVMTYHRWRKQSSPLAPAPPPEGPIAATDHEQIDRIRELQVENGRLRRLVTDLLLEKIKLEERLTSIKTVTRDD